MVLYPDFKIATNHDNEAGFVVVETIIASAPRATPVPLGSAREVSLGGKPRWDGFVNIFWRWGFMTMIDLDTLVTTYLGSWATERANVTIRTIQRGMSGGAMTYGNYNATLWLPTPSDPELGIEGDYIQETTKKVTGLRLRFTDLVAT